MLAGKVEDVAKLQFPVVVSPKLDGVRAIVQGGIVLSRSLKPITNKYVQSMFSKYEYMDGELIVGASNAPDVYRKTVSGVMSEAGEPDVTFCAFDWVQKVKHHLVDTSTKLLEIEADYTAQGYEGIMIRDPHGRYKQGRSTLSEGILIKLKRFQDAEAEIIGTEELMHNYNEDTINELGNIQRSSHKENLFGGDTLGALHVRNCTDGVEFKIGTGFTAAQRKAFWQDRRSMVGQLVTYKFFPVGVKEASRHPVFKGFRDRADL